MERMQKCYQAVIKGIDDNGYVRALIGPSSVDRDKEAIEPEAWAEAMPNFMQHPILLSSHNWYNLQSQIGEIKAFNVTAEGNEVIIEYYHGKGNKEADWAYFLAQKGIAAFSHAFYGKKWEDTSGDDTDAARRRYQLIELLEISQVLVPANPDALQRAMSAMQRDDSVGGSDVKMAIGTLVHKAFESKIWESSAAGQQHDDTPVSGQKAITIRMTAVDAKSFAAYLQNEGITVNLVVGDDQKQVGKSVYDELFESKAAGDSQAATDPDDSVKGLIDDLVSLKSKLEEMTNVRRT